MDFDEWHYKQLNGDLDNCPHEAWERKAYEAGQLEAAERILAMWVKAHDSSMFYDNLTEYVESLK